VLSSRFVIVDDVMRSMIVVEIGVECEENEAEGIFPRIPVQ